MRVGIFTECYHPINNGVVASVDALCAGLRANGHDAIVVAPSFGDAISPSVRIPSLPLPTSTAYRLVVPLLDSDQRALVRGLSVIHTNSPFVTGWMGVRYARMFGLPLVFTYHTQLEEYAHYIPFERTATRRAASTLTRTYANLADAVIVPTPAMEQRLRALGVVAPISVIASGIDVARFARARPTPDLRARLSVPANAKLVLFVSRLAREKNVELAFAALAALDDPNVYLILAGDGPRRMALEAAAREYGVGERTRFLGQIPREELPELYAACDAFVFTSVTETQGLVLAEALASAIPIVAVDAPQTRDVVGTAGRLTAVDPAAVAAGLRSALSAGTRDQSAAHLAFERFSVGTQTRLTIELYDGLRARRRTA